MLAILAYAEVLRRRVVRLRARLERPRSLLDYRSDLFNGIRWRWKYWADDLDSPEELRAFCPTCDSELVPHDNAPGTASKFGCGECNIELPTVVHPDMGLQQFMEAQVKRELRRKGWKP